MKKGGREGNPRLKIMKLVILIILQAEESRAYARSILLAIEREESKDFFEK